MARLVKIFVKWVDIDMELMQAIVKPLLMLLVFVGLLLAGKLFLVNLQYRKSQYGAMSGNSFIRTVFHTGAYGEFLTFVALEKLAGFKMLLTNIYIPKEDGTTTETDLLMLHETGVYVFESKNYSGWIFGDEKHKNWTQVLGRGNKNKFFNPIWQNKGHIRALRNLLTDVDNIDFYSYIVFSERCELKKIRLDSPNVRVLKRNQLLSVVKKDIEKREKVLDENKILSLYETLKKHILVDEQTKLQHIKNIRNARRESEIGAIREDEEL